MRKIALVLALCLLTAFVGAGCSLHHQTVSAAAVAGPTAPDYGGVASCDAIASQVGLEILEQGGNAVDAAVAIAFTEAVTYPAAGNIGGGGFMLVRMADGRSGAIDYRETAPGAATPDMYLDADGEVVPGASTEGYRSVAVPGTVAGMATALRRFGTMTWEQVIEPARRLAADGFAVDEAFVDHPAPGPLAGCATGDILKQPELAATLARIQRYGWREFYAGKTAQLIAAAMQKNGGLITLDDLARYRAVVRRPLRGTYRGYRILTMPPPSTGGFTLLEMLNMLERHDVDFSGDSAPRDEQLLVEIMKRAFADRSQFAGDPDFVDVPVEVLAAKAYARERDATIQPGVATPADQVGAGDPTAHEQQQTTHFSVIDAEGNCVANTYTLNGWYGSGVSVPGAGFYLNDEMDDFTTKLGQPNQFGLIQGEGNVIAPYKRPASSMTPTIVLKEGRPFLVLGSPGGPTIITSVLQVLTHVIDGHLPLPQAVAAPRLHHQWQPDVVEWEAGLAESVRDRLTQSGDTLESDPTTLGDVQALMILADGRLVVVSDGRSGHASAGEK